MLNRLPQAGVGDMIMVVLKGKPDLRKKMHPAVIVVNVKRGDGRAFVSLLRRYCWCDC